MGVTLGRMYRVVMLLVDQMCDLPAGTLWKAGLLRPAC
jgi:hypothetical protein